MRLGYPGAVLLLLAGVGCAARDRAAATPAPAVAAPVPVPVATIRVGAETFRVALLNEAQQLAARRAMAGSAVRIPNGRIVAGTQVNSGWSWHLEDIEFAEMTMEMCDGRPSMVEQAGAGFGGGRFCPWSATVISVEP